MRMGSRSSKHKDKPNHQKTKNVKKRKEKSNPCNLNVDHPVDHAISSSPDPDHYSPPQETRSLSSQHRNSKDITEQPCVVVQPLTVRTPDPVQHIQNRLDMQYQTFEDLLGQAIVSPPPRNTPTPYLKRETLDGRPVPDDNESLKSNAETVISDTSESEISTYEAEQPMRRAFDIYLTEQISANVLILALFARVQTFLNMAKNQQLVNQQWLQQKPLSHLQFLQQEMQYRQKVPPHHVQQLSEEQKQFQQEQQSQLQRHQLSQQQLYQPEMQNRHVQRHQLQQFPEQQNQFQQQHEQQRQLQQCQLYQQQQLKQQEIQYRQPVQPHQLGQLPAQQKQFQQQQEQQGQLQQLSQQQFDQLGMQYRHHVQPHQLQRLPEQQKQLQQDQQRQFQQQFDQLKMQYRQHVQPLQLQQLLEQQKPVPHEQQSQLQHQQFHQPEMNYRQRVQPHHMHQLPEQEKQFQQEQQRQLKLQQQLSQQQFHRQDMQYRQLLQPHQLQQFPEQQNQQQQEQQRQLQVQQLLQQQLMQQEIQYGQPVQPQQFHQLLEQQRQFQQELYTELQQQQQRQHLSRQQLSQQQFHQPEMQYRHVQPHHLQQLPQQQKQYQQEHRRQLQQQQLSQQQFHQQEMQHRQLVQAHQLPQLPTQQKNIQQEQQPQLQQQQLFQQQLSQQQLSQQQLSQQQLSQQQFHQQEIQHRQQVQPHHLEQVPAEQKQFQQQQQQKQQRQFQHSTFEQRERITSESEVTTDEPRQVKRIIAKALTNYESYNDHDLDFVKGEEMEVLSQSGNWWLAIRTSTGEVGYIPSNYFQIKGTSFESQEWWFGADWKEATKQLLLPGNPIGTFLVRKSREEGAYALSFLTVNDKEEPQIRHYKIWTTDEGECYIGNQMKFKDLIELVKYYSENPGLECRLTQPCPKEPQKIPFKEFLVKRSEIQLGEQLGSGDFGTVYAGIFRNVLEVAVKTLKPGSSVNPDDFRMEAETMHIFRHPRLVQLMGVCADADGQSAYIITERMQNGDLLQHLKMDNGELIKFPDLIEMATQVADGMSYLEEQKVIHRDLRAANVLVGDKNSVKISDFGLARLLDSYYDEDDYYKNKKDDKFPFRWTAPEVIRRHMSNSKSDVWSFGVLLSELVTYGELPYNGMTNRTVLDEVTKGYRMPNPSEYGFTCSEKLYAIMLECWNEQPEQRPSFVELRHNLDDHLEDISNYVE